MEKKPFVVGVIGGMGSYATVDFFRRLVEAFPAEKEWERPRIIIDNYCTMPSRVRAILYGEKREELVFDLCDSTMNLLRGGATKIVLACNTSHVFLPDIEEKIPESKGKFLHIIKVLGEDMKSQGIKKSYLLASEGTIQSGIYENTFKPFNITCEVPHEDEYVQLREWIEAVKQNKYTDGLLQSFMDFVDACNMPALILGCTELPILYDRALRSGWIPRIKIFDPLESVIEVLKKEYYA